jgi:hypothetical protein
MKKTALVNGVEVPAMLFKTLKAKENYMSKNPSSQILIIRAGYFLVTK